MRCGVGFRFPSISLHKKLSQLLVEEGGFARRPSITPTVLESILSNLKLKIEKETITNIKSQKL